MNPSLETIAEAFTALLASAKPQPVAEQIAVASVPATAAGTISGTGSAASATPIGALGTCQLTNPKAKGYHLDASVTPDQVVAAAELLDRHGFAIDTITGVDWMAVGQMEVVYDFFHPGAPWHVVVRTRVPRTAPEVPTISGVFPGANWHERETHDFFGIRFLGHPDLSPLLLPEDATYHPLRKDFTGVS